jgi:SAM-dependent methyltransferase
MRCAFVKRSKARVIMSFLLSILSSNVLAGSFHVRKTLVLRSICALRSGGGENNEKIEKEVTSTSSKVSKTMYNKQATKWVRTKPRCLSDFTGRPVVFEMLSAELKSSPSKERGNKIVLDVGCGEGYCARKVVELGASRVIGSDISKEMIKSAVETSKEDGRFRYYSAPCSSLLKGMNENREYLGIERAEESVDIAMAVFLFNYLTTDEMENTIIQIYQTLKPGGVFVFSVPHPSMIFCHEKDAIFRLDSEGKGYYSSRNEKIFGHISTIDGARLNIMSVHKTLNDYVQSISKAGFQIIDIKEVGVTKEHLEKNPGFFNSVKDRPLHLIFKLRKSSSE